MSLRKSPTRTPAFLAAHRRNAWKSTGPRTAKGKIRSSLNALKHGMFARRLVPRLLAVGGLDSTELSSPRALTRGYVSDWVRSVAACSAWKTWLAARRRLQLTMKNFPKRGYRPAKS